MTTVSRTYIAVRQGRKINCDCCKEKIYCSHRDIAVWYVCQYLPSFVKTKKTLCRDRDEDDMVTDEDNNKQSQYEPDQQSCLTSN